MFETQIKQALTNAGLEEGLWEKISPSIKAERDIPDAVKKLKGDQARERLTAALEKDPTLKADYDLVLQSETDRRVNQAVKTHDEKKAKDEEDRRKAEEEAKKKKEEMNKNNPNPEDKDTPAWAKTIIEQNAAMNKRIDEIETGKKKGDVEALRKKLFTDAKLPDRYMKYVTGDTEEEIAASIESVKGDFEAENRSAVEKNLTDLGIPVTSQSTPPGAMETNIASYAQNKSKAAQGGGGLLSKQVAKSEKKE